MLKRDKINELYINNKTVVFVILRHISDITHNMLWINSYNSIRNFYTNKIIIIDDNSKLIPEYFETVNTETINSEYKGAGELLPYYYFLKFKWADNMIYLQDSMFLIKPFSDYELKTNIMLWNFTIRTCDNKKRIEEYINYLTNSNILYNIYKGNMWKGCFGVSTIMSIDLLKEIEEKYNFCGNLISNIINKNDRECIERILGIILFSLSSNNSLYGNINDDYPMSFKILSIEDGIKNIIKNNYQTSICKIWRGR